MEQPFPDASTVSADAVRAVFERLGLRCTRQRVEIYEALRASKAHPTAEELFSVVRQGQPGLSLATVYNTLDVLCTNGLCRKLPSADTVARYDADVTDHVHVTMPDGRVRDVPSELGDRILRSVPAPLLGEVAARLGVDIRQLRIELLADRPTPVDPTPNGS
jgi:Fe2+ or Zn2+ uptake regulation protein